MKKGELMKYKVGDIVEFTTEGSSRKRVGYILKIYNKEYLVSHILTKAQYLVSYQNVYERKKLCN